MPWLTFCSSAIGVDHVRFGLPCQDYAAVRSLHDSRVAAAVADGAGSRKRSEEGARIAVETALTFAEANLPATWCPETGSASAFFTALVTEVRRKLAEYGVLGGADVREFASTLLVVVATRQWLAGMQIGDGFICARQPGQDAYDLLIEPIRGEYAGETVFVTCPNAVESLRCCVRMMGPDFLCLSSDGMEELAVAERPWRAHQPFFSSFEKSVRQLQKPAHGAVALSQFLGSAQVNGRTHDDKSMVVCLHRESDEDQAPGQQASARQPEAGPLPAAPSAWPVPVGPPTGIVNVVQATPTGSLSDRDPPAALDPVGSAHDATGGGSAQESGA